MSNQQGISGTDRPEAEMMPEQRNTGEMFRKRGQRLPGWLKKGLVGAGLLLLLISGSILFDAYESRQALLNYPPPGNFVQVPAGKMHYVCAGSGEPTLVLVAGYGGGGLDWSPFMPVLSANQHVCAFDRLGQDWSDPAPHPRTFATAADELHEALVALGIKKPVLIGHSLGGALVQIYAARYPVAGVALLEGLTTDNVDSVVARLGSYGQLELLARTGLLRLVAGAFVDPANQQAAAVQAEMYALRSRSAALVSVADEGVVAQQSAGVELRAAEAGLHVPLLLVGAGRSAVPGLPVGAFAEALQALARRKPDARYVLIPDGSHFVFTDHPAVVAATVQDWLRSGLVHR